MWRGGAESGKRGDGAVWLHRRHGLCARGEMRCVVPAHWSRLNVIDGEAAVLGRDGSVPVSIELSRQEERCAIKGTSFDRTINHLRHGPDMGTILCNSS
jgi:hypothetical protein